MAPQSTHTKLQRQVRYVPGSSRGKHSAATLLAQVADIERGTRIRERREELHLTQPAVVDLLEAAALELPAEHELHPANAGKPPVTLRGYQTYEKGGGIVWEKAKLLAKVLQLDVQAMMNGEPEEPRATPSPFAGQDSVVELLDAIEKRATAQLAEHAAKVERLLRDQDALLARQSAILERIEAAIDRDAQNRETLTGDVEDWVRLSRELVQGRPEAPRDSPPAPQRNAAAKR